MADVIYNSYKKDLLDGNIDHVADTIKIALVTSAYTANQDTHKFFSDITNEVTGTGYTAGGDALATKTTSQNDTTNKGVFDADDTIWATSTITARGAIVYKDTGTASTSPLICFIDFVTDQSSSVGDFKIQWDAIGIITIG